MEAMRYAISQPASLVPGGFAVLVRLGGAITGIAIALTVARQPVLGLATAVILAIGGGAVAALSTVHLIAYYLVAALGWWAVTITAHTLLAAYARAADRVRRLLSAPPDDTS
jgi:hypothetical protein